MHFLAGDMFSQTKCTLLGMAWGKRRKLTGQLFKLCKIWDKKFQDSIKDFPPGTRQAWRRCCTSNNNFSKSQRWLLLPEDRTGSVPRRTGWSTEGRRQWAELSASPSNHLRSVYVYVCPSWPNPTNPNLVKQPECPVVDAWFGFSQQSFGAFNGNQHSSHGSSLKPLSSESSSLLGACFNSCQLKSNTFTSAIFTRSCLSKSCSFHFIRHLDYSHCTMCILGTTMALWSKAEIQKYTFWWEKNIFEAIFPMLF